MTVHTFNACELNTENVHLPQQRKPAFNTKYACVSSSNFVFVGLANNN